MSEINDIQVTVDQLHSLPTELSNAAFEILVKQSLVIVGLAQVNVRVHTGALRDSIHAEITVNSEAIKQVTIKAGGVTAPYAAIIEAKYPYLSPAVEEVKPTLHEQLQTVIQGVVNEHS